MDWTLEAIDRLRDMWAQGLSTAEIGRRMGVSRHAITGKAHRLKLPMRPSPIRRDPAAPRPLTMGRRTTLPKIETAAVAGEAPIGGRDTLTALGVINGQAALAEGPVTRPAAAPPPFRRVTECCWPIGEPGTEEFQFCGKDSMSGKPYCAEHAGIAYVKPRGDARKNDVA
jgi:GcrA cell cycle regulator